MIHTIEIFEEYDFGKMGQPIQSKRYDQAFMEWQHKMKKEKNFKIRSVEQIKNTFSAGIFVVYEL